MAVLNRNKEKFSNEILENEMLEQTFGSNEIENEFDFSKPKNETLETNNFQPINMYIISFMIFLGLFVGYFHFSKTDKVNNMLNKQQEYIEAKYFKEFENKKDLGEILPSLLNYSQESLMSKDKTLNWIDEHIKDGIFYMSNSKITIQKTLNEDEKNMISRIVNNTINISDINNKNNFSVYIDSNKDLIKSVKLKVFLLNNPDKLKEFNNISYNKEFIDMFISKNKEEINSINLFKDKD